MAAAAVVPSQPTPYRSTAGVPLPSALQGGLTDVLLAPAIERHTQMEHIKQLKEFGLGFEPRRADSKDAFSFDPDRHRTRMNWLYGRLAEEGEKHTYTVAAKEWILNRQTRVDMAARRGRKNTAWWEYPESQPSPVPGTGTTPTTTPATPGTPAAKKATAAATASPRPSGVPAKLDPVLTLSKAPKVASPPTPAKVEVKKEEPKPKKEVPKKEEELPPPPPEDDPPPPPPEEDDAPPPPGALDALTTLTAADTIAVPRLTGPVELNQTLNTIALRAAFRIFLETGTENPNAYSSQVDALKASLDDFDHSANLRNLDFFEDIERWKDRFYPHESRIRSSSVAVAPSGGRPGFDMKSLLAKKLYSKFLRDDDEDVPGGGAGGGDDKRLALTLSPAQRNRIQARLNLPLTMYPEAPPIGAMGDDDDDDTKGTPRQSVKAIPVAVSTPAAATPQSLQDAVNQLLSASDFAALASHVGANTAATDAKDSPKPSVIYETKNLVILSKDEDKKLRAGGASEEVWDEVLELVRFELAKMMPLFNLSPAIEKMRKADDEKAAAAKEAEQRKKEREQQRIEYEAAMKLRKEKEEAARAAAEAKRLQMEKAKADRNEDDDDDDDDDDNGPDDPPTTIPDAPEGPVTDFSDIGSPQAVRRRRKGKYDVVPAGPTNMAGVFGHPKPQAWKNDGGYQSVVLDIIELRGGAACGGPGGSAPSQEQNGSQGEAGNNANDCTPNKGQTKWYCHVSVDSTTYRSKETWGLFNDHMEFILSDTTQYVQVELYRSKEETQMVGYVLVPIQEIVTETKQTRDEAAAVDTVLRNASAQVNLVTPTGGAAGAQAGGMGSTGVAAAAGTILTPPTVDKDGKPIEAKDDLALEPQWYKIELPPNTAISDKTSSVLTMELFFNINLLKREAKEDTEHKAIIVAEEKSALADAIRGKVSKKKKRWQQDGFDLDLTYVTPQIIAMGFPSEGSEGVFRNHMRDVQRFFTRRHPTSYKIYNLCSERAYDPEKFEGSAVRYPFDDHNPCPMAIMHGFCEDMRQWIQAHPQNVTAVHCKAGKGRTGTVIAAYLIYCGQEKTADEALEFFGRARTKNNKGVTIPSQMRYVHYFESYIKMKKRRLPQPGPCTLFLHAVVLHKIPKGVSAGAEVSFVIKQTVGDKKWKSSEKMPAILDKESATITFDIQSKIVSLNEDCKFEFYHNTALGTKKMFHFWFNTRFQKLEWAPTREGHTRNSNGDSGSDDDDGEDDDEDEDDSDDESGAPPGTPSSAAKKVAAKTETKEAKKPAAVTTPASPAKTIATATPAKTAAPATTAATPAVAAKVPSSPVVPAKASPATPVTGASPAKAAPSTLALPASAVASPSTPRSSATAPGGSGAPLSEKEQKKADKKDKKKVKDLSPAEKYSATPPPWPEMIVYPNHPRIRFHKGQLDKAVKDKKHKKYHKDFQVEVIVTRTSMSTVVKQREVTEAEGSALPAAVLESRGASSSLKIVTSTPASTTRPLATSTGAATPSSAAGTPAKTPVAATTATGVAAKR